MTTNTITRTFLLALIGVALAIPAQAQLPSAGAAPLGTADNYTALARGFTAIALNPAGLGMPGNPGFSMTMIPVQARSGLAPIGLGDIKQYEGVKIPRDQKIEWLDQIVRSGGITGSGGAEVSAFAMNVRNFGFQISTVADVSATLNGDAAELLLFGNAGLDGEPHDFDLDGSTLDAFAATTVAVSYGHGLNLPINLPGSKFAVGATVKYTVGHALVLGRDAGSLLSSDPIEVELRFPTIGPGEEFDAMNAGQGFGLDLGAAWEFGPWSAGASVQNVISTFEWNVDELAYRPGEAYFNDTDNGSDFDEQPAVNAPDELLAEVKELGFDPRMVIGVAYRTPVQVTVTADIRHTLGDGLALGGRTHAGLGVMYSPLKFLPLRAGITVVPDAVRYAGGAGISLGVVNLTGAAILQRGDAGDTTGGMVAFSFGAF